MSIIIDNYETIVKTIVKCIRDGSIISNNSDKLEGLNTKELFKLFTQEFNLVHSKSKIVSGLYFENNILGIPFPNKCVFVNNIYFNGIGDIEISEELSLNLSDDNVLYFDLNALNIPSQWISQHSIVTLDYVGYNEDII